MTASEDSSGQPLSDDEITSSGPQAATRTIGAPLKEFRLLLAPTVAQNPDTQISVPLKLLRQLLVVAEEFHKVPRPPAAPLAPGFALAANAAAAQRVADAGAGADFNDLSYDSVDTDTSGLDQDGIVDMLGGADSKVNDNDY